MPETLEESEILQIGTELNEDPLEKALDSHMKPIFSIAIANYNTRALTERCLSSVLATAPMDRVEMPTWYGLSRQGNYDYRAVAFRSSAPKDQAQHR